MKKGNFTDDFGTSALLNFPCPFRLQLERLKAAKTYKA
jgi:hypothetical protein